MTGHQALDDGSVRCVLHVANDVVVDEAWPNANRLSTGYDVDGFRALFFSLTIDGCPGAFVRLVRHFIECLGERGESDSADGAVGLGKNLLALSAAHFRTDEATHHQTGPPFRAKVYPSCDEAIVGPHQIGVLLSSKRRLVYKAGLAQRPTGFCLSQDLQSNTEFATVAIQIIVSDGDTTVGQGRDHRMACQDRRIPLSFVRD